MPETTHGYLEGAGGLRLFFRSWRIREARGRLLVVHGLGEHSARYDRVAAAAHRVGLDCWALDLRGHGRSQGRRGHVRRFEHLLQDVDRLRRLAGGAGGSPPTALLGHSLGGLVAGRYLEEFACPNLCGAVLVAPFLALSMPVPGWKRALGRVAETLIPALTLDNGIAVEDLFREEDERLAYTTDPLVHRRISARLWGEMQRNAERLLEGGERIGTPVLLQLPGEDRVVASGAARELGARLAGPVEVREYPDACHALYHDPCAGDATRDLERWLDRRVESCLAA